MLSQTVCDVHALIARNRETIKPKETLSEPPYVIPNKMRNLWHSIS